MLRVGLTILELATIPINYLIHLFLDPLDEQVTTLSIPVFINDTVASEHRLQPISNVYTFRLIAAINESFDTLEDFFRVCSPLVD